MGESLLIDGKGTPRENDCQGEGFGGEGCCQCCKEYDMSCSNSTAGFIGGLPGIILVEVGK